MTSFRPDFPPEFSRRVPVSRIGVSGMEQVIEASSAECRALSGRLQLPAIASLTCRFRLLPPLRGQVAAEAELRAELTRICVVTLEPFEASIAERFTLRFVPEGAEEDDMDPESPDEISYVGDSIDLGEATAEQLALALDPYPRKPGVTLPGNAESETAESREADGPAADQPHPFAALARLRGGGPPSGNA